MHDKIVDITARLSELALVQGDAALALAYVAEAVGQGRQLNLKLPLARALTSSGQYYLQQQNLEEARRSYTEARQILLTTNNLDLTARVHIALGRIAWLCGDRTQAQQAFAQALTLFEERPFPRQQALTHRELAEGYCDLRAYDPAREHVAAARQIFEQLGITYQVEQLTDLRARIDEEATAASETEQSRSSA